jgi:hypothetical protein
MKTYSVLFIGLFLLCYSILDRNINLLGLSELIIFSSFFVLYCKAHHLKRFKLVLWWIKINYIQLVSTFVIGYFIVYQFVIRSIFDF